MRQATQRIILLLMFLIGAMTVSAQPTGNRGRAKDFMGIEVHFRFDKSSLDLSYMGNEQSLARFAHIIDSIGLHVIDSVVIVSQSSPEGVYEHNLKLSRQRAATMRTVIGQRHPELEGRLHVHPDGESWAQLREYVKNDTKMKQSTIDKVISIIDSDVNVGTKKWRLEQLPIYRYLRTTYFPRIRNSVFCILYYDTMPVVEEPAPTVTEEIVEEETEAVAVVPADTVPVIEEPAPKPAYVWAVKSNLLYDIALVPNLGVEFTLPMGWSLAGSWEYAWWNATSIYWRIYGGELALRKWWGKAAQEKSLSGHHVGLYAQAFTYDFMLDGHGYQSGDPGQTLFDRASYAVGVEYGYSLPLCTSLHLDFVLGMGYQGGKFNEYRHVDDHYVWQALKRRHFVGPTKAEVSLVWRFGQEGGAR